MFNFAALLGAVIGFFLGFRFLGFLGGLIGASLGSSLGILIHQRGRGAGKEGSEWFSGLGGRVGTNGTLFFECLFSMLGRLAAADGRVSLEEERILRQIISRELRIINPASIESAVSIFRRAAAEGKPLGDYARQARDAFRTRPQLLEMMLDIMVRVAASEGGLHPEEDRLLRETAAVFGFAPGLYESLKRHYGLSGGGFRASSGTGGEDPYAVLGVSSTVGESELRKAYRKKAAEYHPDKIAAKGLPKDFTDLANQKFQEIQGAWESIRKDRGF